MRSERTIKPAPSSLACNYSPVELGMNQVFVLRSGSHLRTIAKLASSAWSGRIERLQKGFQISVGSAQGISTGIALLIAGNDPDYGDPTAVPEDLCSRATYSR